MTNKIKKLIINSPFEEPKHHWDYDKTQIKHFKKEGRRPAGYTILGENQEVETGTPVELPLVNKIRPRVKEWRENGYPNATAITRRLLKSWNTSEDEGRDIEFFFCQKEAIETLIWLKEADPSKRVGIHIKGDDGDFERLCCKMATGTGKTFVMSMLIAWQILNKTTYPKDGRFSKNVLVLAPNLTVKSRLSVLDPKSPENYYQRYKIVPNDLMPFFVQGRIIIENWHTLAWEDEEKIRKKKSVDKRGAKSDQAYLREVLGDMANANGLFVINDEAHHAWRERSQDAPQRRTVMTGENPTKEDRAQATCWIKGLDRINQAMSKGISTCFDFSATPFVPSGSKSRAAYGYDLFSWIVSDFGLTDAIESGLTKTPRFVVRDDGPGDTKTLESKLRNIYNNGSVKSNLQREAEKDEGLPQLVRDAYCLLGFDWQKTYEKWNEEKMPTPPVMISVVNRTETADRIAYSFEKKRLSVVKELSEKMEVIHSKIDDNTKDSDLRERVNTVGKIGKSGEQIRHVISVAMLSEGWDCSTVTHIMGLRAFSSQLLCEQIVGRGLRRTSYELNKDTKMFDPEYVNVFGIPFAFLPSEEAGGVVRPTSSKHPVFPKKERKKYEITIPNIVRIDHNIKPVLSVNFDQVEPLEISNIRTMAELAPLINGQPDYDKITTIDLQKLLEDKDDRMQTVLIKTAANVYDGMDEEWKTKLTRPNAMKQIFSIVEDFLDSNKFQIRPSSFMEDETKKTIAIIMGMEQIIRKILSVITVQNADEMMPVYGRPKFRFTGDATEWRTSKKWEAFEKTHMNICVVDSTWEATYARELDKNKNVEAWVKNDHIGFDVPYFHEGVFKNYRPDFVARLVQGHHLVVEVKGKKRDKDISKWDFMEKWILAVNNDGENGKWHFRVCEDETGKVVHRIIEEILGQSSQDVAYRKEKGLKERADMAKKAVEEEASRRRRKVAVEGKEVSAHEEKRLTDRVKASRNKLIQKKRKKS